MTHEEISNPNRIAEALEAELAEGAAAAIQKDPNLFEHLQKCGECAGTYTTTKNLVNAEERGEIKTPRPVKE
jgi:hypothetical protein